MDYFKIYKKSALKIFKAKGAMILAGEKIQAEARRVVFDKYKDDKLKCDDMEFSLLGVTTYLYIGSDVNEEKLRISLLYVVSSKLPKARAQAVDEAKKFFITDKRLPWASNHKHQLWYTLEYHLTLDDVVKGDFRFSRKLGDSE